jgi:DNA-binding CsgD family transcriptional regulator
MRSSRHPVRVPAPHNDPLPTPSTANLHVRCGAELVALTEDYYQRMFRSAIDLHFVIVFFALLTTALRDGRNHPEWTLVALGIVTAAAGWARRHLRDAYAALRNPALLLTGAAVFAVLLIVDDPLNSPLWWVGLGVLLVPAVTGDLRWNCACAAILTLGYAAGVAAHDHIDLALHDPDLALKASGFGFWSLLLYAKINRAARFFMSWHRAVPDARLPPRRVRVEAHAATQPEDDVPTQRTSPPLAVNRGTSDTTLDARSTSQTVNTGSGQTERSSFSPRQQQVLMLLADGHSEREIAKCLRISEKQVQRHVRNAKNRVGANSTPELVLIAVRDGVVPP